MVGVPEPFIMEGKRHNGTVAGAGYTSVSSNEVLFIFVWTEGMQRVHSRTEAVASPVLPDVLLQGRYALRVGEFMGRPNGGDSKKLESFSLVPAVRHAE